MKQKLKLGISPCPNDTFIYENLIQGLPNSPFEFEVYFEDVQTLNEMVQQNFLDVAKVSCGVIPEILKDYRVLCCGGAIGYSCGPLLLGSRSSVFENVETVLPGKNTTAALLFRFFMQEMFNEKPKTEYALFNEVYKKLKAKQIKQGVVIHEHRFTYARDGLFLIQDLGAFFETKTGVPVPLGAAVLKKSFSNDLQKELESEFQKSLTLAKNRENSVTPFILEKAQIEDISVIESHIKTFVTDFSFDMGAKGKAALQKLFETFQNN